MRQRLNKLNCCIATRCATMKSSLQYIGLSCLSVSTHGDIVDSPLLLLSSHCSFRSRLTSSPKSTPPPWRSLLVLAPKQRSILPSRRTEFSRIHSGLRSLVQPCSKAASSPNGSHSLLNISSLLEQVNT